MECQVCHSRLKCVDSRPVNSRERWRTYHCKSCGLTYTSIEYLDPKPTKTRRLKNET